MDSSVEVDAGDAGTRDASNSDGGADGGTDAGVDADTCVDEDGDGYGDGCALGPDCDDGDENISPAVAEVCDGVDNDCNGTADDELTGPSCDLTEGVCAGAVARCGGEDGFVTCEAADYGATYESDETLCDGLDNDCDGTTDEGCMCIDGETQGCGSDVGECRRGTQTCAGSMFGACEGEVGPMGESCDGLDNDCDGMEDEAGDLTPPDCPLQLGVCAGSKRACGGIAGWVACSGIASYGGDFQESETLCDGLDNDCDGVTDEGCECVDGATQACGSDVGACMGGTQTCTSGAFGACAGEIAPVDETCNGVDDDCDGTVDDNLIAPACALQQGVCAGSVQRCGGAGGFEACGAAEYGPSYQADESACDGQDNDCDGTIDEGCDCLDGATQECGLSVGVCERGVQTCVAGEFGACEGAVDPAPEICNGQDDDCNGASDDNLVLPPCALTEGVCAGTTQACGGAAGLIACVPADYGPDYVDVEDGAVEEGVCDGLDNDCDGEIDEGCTTAPLQSDFDDLVGPHLHNQHLVFMQNYDGNWDINFVDLNRGITQRLTTTSANEWFPIVYGNYVAYRRGEGEDARTVLYDLVSGTESVLTSVESQDYDIFGRTVVYDEFDGTQWDVFLYDIPTGDVANIAPGSAVDELQPSVRGTRVAYVSNATGDFLTTVVDVADPLGMAVTQTPASLSSFGQFRPIVDYAAIAWTDARAVTDPDAFDADFDVYGAFLAGTEMLYPDEAVVAAPVATQFVDDVDGTFVSYSDNQGGDFNVAIGTIGGTSTQLTSHPGTQANPSLSGAFCVWQDNRRGTFDIYATFLDGIATPPDAAGLFVFTEILADPPVGADPNGDGSADTTEDEFVELVNNTGLPLDLSGGTLSDGTRVRHTFPPRTVVPAGGTIVVFGGGSPGRLFGGAIVQIATTGGLGLANSGDTLALRVGSLTVASSSYGSEGGMDQSLTLDEEGSLVLHTTLVTERFSPGLSPNGFVF
ncbi:MAG: MopE-related protein [Myxococcota bacterium]